MTLLSSLVGPGVPPTSPHDSVLVVRTPEGFRLPSGPSALTRALFDRPQEVQWAAISVGALVFAVGAFFAIRYRRELLTWVQTRSRPVLLGMVAAAAIAVIALGLVGWNGYQMMEHDNAFCTSCHLMHPMIAQFYQTRHRHLECHDCHKQSMLADTRELELWVVERPGQVPPHENVVPNRICEGCHTGGNGGDRSEAKQIDRSAGHMVHLKSARQPGMECTQCHSRPTVHVFRPTNATCMQAGCHDDITVKLGKMQGLNLQCTTCHEFMRPKGTIRPPFDTLERTILPVRAQCESCHQMKDRLAKQSFAGDPHREQCGLCHPPHRQTEARAAAASCSTGGCHARPDPLSRFHVGIPPRALAQCSNCHNPHTWKAKGKICTDCHANPDGPLPGEVQQNLEVRGKSSAAAGAP